MGIATYISSGQSGKKSDPTFPGYKEILIGMLNLAEKYFIGKSRVFMTYDEEMKEHIFDITTAENPFKKARKNLISLRVPESKKVPTTLNVIGIQEGCEEIYEDTLKFFAEKYNITPEKIKELRGPFPRESNFSSLSFGTTRPSSGEIKEMSESGKHFNWTPHPWDMYPIITRDFFIGYSWWDEVTDFLK